MSLHSNENFITFHSLCSLKFALQTQVDQWIEEDELEGVSHNVDEIYLKVGDQRKSPSKYKRYPCCTTDIGTSQMMDYKKIVEELRTENDTLKERLQVSEEKASNMQLNFHALSKKVDFLMNARQPSATDNNEIQGMRKNYKFHMLIFILFQIHIYVRDDAFYIFFDQMHE